MSSSVDNEKVKKTISVVLEKIATETDLLTLGEYQSIFKKEVPFFRRSQAAAYLLMLCDQGKKLHVSGTEKKPFRKTRNSFQWKEGSSAFKDTVSGTVRGDDAPGYLLTEKESKRLFFSAGRSRKVYPREILALINAKTAVPKEDIGEIRILDNYSFVQVRDRVAEKIIEALNGVNFRGRSLTVNYAKFRREEENGAEENGAGENENGYTADPELSTTDPEYVEEQPIGGVRDSEQNSEQN